LPGLVIRDCLFREMVQPALRHVLLKLPVPLFGVERVEPLAEFGKLIRRKLRNGLLDVFQFHRHLTALS